MSKVEADEASSQDLQRGLYKITRGGAHCDAQMALSRRSEKEDMQAYRFEVLAALLHVFGCTNLLLRYLTN